MLVNLALGVLVMAISVVLHTFGLIAVTHSISHVTSRVRVHGHRSRVIAMVTTAIGIFGVLFLQVAIWACFYLMLGTVDDLETALYFSAVTFSTLGYGDLVPSHEWRLFSALQGRRSPDDRMVHGISHRRRTARRAVPGGRAFLAPWLCTGLLETAASIP